MNVIVAVFVTALFALTGVAHGAEVTAKKITDAEAPKIDANVDKIWDSVRATKIPVAEGKIGKIEVTMKVLYTDKDLYFLFQWSDETESLGRYYEFDGKAGEKFYAIKVSAEGKVLKVKEESKEEQGEDEQGEDGGKDEQIGLDKVPEAVKKAATDAVKDIVFSLAEKETKGNATTYELKGKAGEKFYEVVVSAEGKVLKTKEVSKEEREADEKEAKK